MIKCHLRLPGGMVFPIQIHRRHLKYLIYALMGETGWSKFRKKFFPKKPRKVKYTMIPAKKEEIPTVAADKKERFILDDDIEAPTT